MQRTQNRRPITAVAAALIGLGGLLMMSGSIFPFAKGSAGGPFEGSSPTGFDLGYTLLGVRVLAGVLYVAVGFALVALALVIRGQRSPALNGTAVVLVILLAILMVYISIDIARLGGRPGIDTAVGAVIVQLGSIVAVVGGALSFIVQGIAYVRSPPPGALSMPSAQQPEPPSEATPS